MKELIRHILKEEVNNSKNITKGINLAVKLLSKKYPFIVGWKLANELNEYTYTIYVNLLVDFPKVKEYYGLETNKVYLRSPEFIYDSGHGRPYPFSALDYDKVFDDPFMINKELVNNFSDIYNDLPDSLKMERDDDKYKDINVDSYFYVK
jgi:hypothetical protein